MYQIRTLWNGPSPLTISGWMQARLFDQLEQLVEIASDRILAMPGVHHVETSIAVKTIKYNARIVKITGARNLADNGD